MTATEFVRLIALAALKQDRPVLAVDFEPDHKTKQIVFMMRFKP